MPGVNAPNAGGAPSVRASVAPTVPPTPPGVSVRPTPNVLDWTADTLPLMSTASHLTVVRPKRLIVRTSPTLRARWAL